MSMLTLCCCHDALDKISLCLSVSHSIFRVPFCQTNLQTLVLARDLRMLGEIIPKQQTFPMLFEISVARHHVNVMRSDSALVSLDKECVPGWNVVAKGRSPEIIVATFS